MNRQRTGRFLSRRLATLAAAASVTAATAALAFANPVNHIPATSFEAHTESCAYRSAPVNGITMSRCEISNRSGAPSSETADPTTTIVSAAGSSNALSAGWRAPVMVLGAVIVAVIAVAAFSVVHRRTKRAKHCR